MWRVTAEHRLFACGASGVLHRNRPARTNAKPRNRQLRDGKEDTRSQLEGISIDKSSVFRRAAYGHQYRSTLQRTLGAFATMVWQLCSCGPGPMRVTPEKCRAHPDPLQRTQTWAHANACVAVGEPHPTMLPAWASCIRRSVVDLDATTSLTMRSQRARWSACANGGSQRMNVSPVAAEGVMASPAQRQCRGCPRGATRVGERGERHRVLPHDKSAMAPAFETAKTERARRNAVVVLISRTRQQAALPTTDLPAR